MRNGALHRDGPMIFIPIFRPHDLLMQPTRTILTTLVGKVHCHEIYPVSIYRADVK